MVDLLSMVQKGQQWPTSWRVCQKTWWFPSSVRKLVRTNTCKTFVTQSVSGTKRTCFASRFGPPGFANRHETQVFHDWTNVVDRMLRDWWSWAGEKKTFVTQSSRVVPNRSTTWAQWRFTAQFRWDAVLSPWCERMMKWIVAEYD